MSAHRSGAGGEVAPGFPWASAHCLGMKIFGETSTRRQSGNGRAGAQPTRAFPAGDGERSWPAGRRGSVGRTLCSCVGRIWGPLSSYETNPAGTREG